MPAWTTTAAHITAFIFMLIALLGLAMPVFPGLVVIWGIMLVHGLVTGFTMHWGWFLFISLLMIAGSLADNVLMGAKARQGGASWSSIALALGGAVIASFFFTPIAGLLAAPILLFGAEYAHRKEAAAAWEVAKGLLIGWGWAFMLRFALGALRIGLWAWQTF